MEYSYRNKTVSPKEIYHITQRAPGTEKIFVEENDYLTMLSSLKEWQKEFFIDIFAFCLMPNHYHLLLQIHEPNLSQAMHSLNTSYAMKFNLKYKRKGHVFCGVYRAGLCLDDIHLIGSSLYIHINPQKAGLVKNSYDYRWSSVKVYLEPSLSSFVKSGFILKIIDEDLKKASSLYRTMVESYSLLNCDDLIENQRAVINFCKNIFHDLLQLLKHKFINKSFLEGELTLDKMIEEFRNKKGKAKPENKEAMIYLIEQLKSRGFNTGEIANTLNISRQYLYKLTNKVEP